MGATEQEGDEPWLPCVRFTGAPGYDLGVAIGTRFRNLIRSRLASDPALHSDMLPFAATHEGHQLLAALTAANRYSLARFSEFLLRKSQRIPMHQRTHHLDTICRSCEGSDAGASNLCKILE